MEAQALIAIVRLMAEEQPVKFLWRPTTIDARGVNGLICAWQRNEKIKGIKLKIIKSDTRQKSIGRAADEWIFMRHTHLFT